MLGATDGSTVEASASVGSKVGVTEGERLGRTLGTALGRRVGFLVGVREGLTEGTAAFALNWPSAATPASPVCSAISFRFAANAFISASERKIKRSSSCMS